MAIDRKKHEGSSTAEQVSRAHGSPVPNHHAHYPAFRGISGLVAATSMAVGRSASTELAISLSGLSPHDHLLDLGCGPGAPTRAVAKLVARVTAIDPAPVMLRVARLIPSSSNITWKLGSAASIDLDDATVNVVWALATVHHWTDVELGVREVLRVLRRGGRFIAIERQRTAGTTIHASHGWTLEQGEAFAAACRDGGFDTAAATTHTTNEDTHIAVVATRAE